MDVTTPDQPTTTATPIDPAEASFDIVARQESTEAALADLRSDPTVCDCTYLNRYLTVLPI